MKAKATTVFRELTPARRQMLRLLQYLNNGRIEGLIVEDGQSLFDLLSVYIFCAASAAEGVSV